MQKNDMSVYFRNTPQSRNWGWFLFLGVLLTVLGVVSIAYSGWTTILSVAVIGCFILAAGVIQVINAFHAHKWTGISLNILLGILYLVVGTLCIMNPIESALSLTLVIAAFFWIGGLFRMISAPILRFDHWGWVMFNGFLAFILGILIFLQWPVSGLWVIGFFIGIDMLFVGLSWILLALGARPSQLR